MITWINLCLWGPPASVYNGSRGGAASQEEGAPGGVLLPPGVGFPPFQVGIGFGRGERGEREGRGAPPPSPWSGPNWTREGGRPLPSFSFSLPLFLFHMGGGILLGLGSPSRAPHLARPLLGPASSSSILYILRQGAPHGHKLIHVILLLAVCSAPCHHSTR